jgi:tyrosine-protein kinase Etk/Wzc
MTDTPRTPAELDEDGINFLDLLQVIADNLRLLVLVPLVAGLLALAYSFTITPSYTAKARFLPPAQQQNSAASMLASLGNLGGLAGAVGGIKNPADQFLAYLKSAVLQNALIDRLKLQDQFEVKTKTAAREILARKVTAATGKDGLITIEVSDKDPKLAAELANAHIEELGTLMGRFAVTEAQNRRLFFEKQLTQAKDRLTQSEIELKATGVSGGALKSNPASAITAVAALQAQVTAQEVKVGAMRGYLAETAPDFKQAMTELINLRVQLAKQEKDAPSASEASTEGDYVTKYRNYKYHETLFELFTKQYEVAKVDEAREGTVIQVLDPAEPPTLKSGPKKAQMAITATLVMAFVLLLFVFIRHALRKAADHAETAQKLVRLQASLLKAIGK